MWNIMTACLKDPSCKSFQPAESSKYSASFLFGFLLHSPACSSNLLCATLSLMVYCPSGPSVSFVITSIFTQKSIKMKSVNWFSLRLLSELFFFLISGRILLKKCPIFCLISTPFKFSWQSFHKISRCKMSQKNLPAWELFYADRQTGRQIWWST